MTTLTDPTATPAAAAPADPKPRRSGRGRPQADRDAARRRLRRETLVRLAALAGERLDLNGVNCFPTLGVLTRWGLEGRRGVYLDVTRFARGGDWFTSREAVARFVEANDAAFWAEYAAARSAATPTT